MTSQKTVLKKYRKRKRRMEKATVLITISSSAVCRLRAHGKRMQSTNRKTSPLAFFRVDWMTEVTCSHELSSLSMNNSSLKLLSS
ncbi:hypothetical protein AYI68_g6567 [Smittium mucronatum]|uniref:Uncharacterized protein n=1 Tax=Smittium mucronatum TaxID=133383 RepID=A0A1R0GR44_9FUNG|nr:hypothetical protein AYI68_g6567 [Smittium mucronatum]